MLRIFLTFLISMNVFAGDPALEQFNNGKKALQNGNKALAVYCLTRATQLGHPDAPFQLSEVLKEEAGGLSHIPAEAIELIQIGARRGDPIAQRALADMYMGGNGVTQSTTDAKKWYRILKTNKRRANPDLPELTPPPFK